MPSDLTPLLRASRHRVLHLIGIVAALMLLISVVAIVRVATTTDIRGASNLVAWGVGCAGFAVVATLWYRARVRAIAQLEAAVATGAALYRCQVTAVFVKSIPLGYEVDLIAVDTARETSSYLAFGFWTHASATQLFDLLQPHVAPGAPPAFPIKMRAPNRR